ncbi:MAG: CapA family protein [Mycoplasmatales bacterium]
MNQKIKIGVLVSIILIIIILVSSWFFLSKQDNKVKLKEDTGVSFSIVGDIIAHDSVNINAKDKYEELIDPDLLKMIQDSDIAFANQESMSSDKYEVEGYPTFNAPYSLIDSIAKMGFDLISIANNHALDRGKEPIKDTYNYYKDNYPDITVAGYNDSCNDMKPKTFNKKGISFSYNAFTYGVNVPSNLSNCNVNIINDDTYKEKIDALGKDKSDVNIVSLHFGTENESELTDQDKEIVQYLLDSGIEIIIGSHPHVLKPIEKTTNSEGNDALVMYSMGNFLSSQLDFEQRVGGIVNFNIVKEDNIKINDVVFTPTYQWYKYKNSDDILSRYDLKTLDLESLSLIDKDLTNDVVDYIKNIFDKEFLKYYPSKPYENINTLTEFNYLSLVNKQSCLPDTYEPKKIITPDVLGSTRTSKDVQVIDKSIEPNVIDLFNAAKEAGYNLVFVSGYRPYTTQEGLYNSYAGSEGIVEADTYSARPGCSEHQTGIAFDLSEQSVDKDGLFAFNNTDAANWVKDNAHKYGFIIRYPEDKEFITQYVYESWHLRYVGVEEATYMYEHNLTLDEYVFNMNK